LQEELARIHSAAPDRSTIMAAIKNLESLWDHLTVGERSRLMTRLVERIDHDPVASNLSITLSPTGLKSFNAELSAQTTNTNPNSTSAHA
jgi:hypothetical protein